MNIYIYTYVYVYIFMYTYIKIYVWCRVLQIYCSVLHCVRDLLSPWTALASRSRWVAVSWSVQQCVGSVLQYQREPVTTLGSRSKYVAVGCSVLQYVAECVVQSAAMRARTTVAADSISATIKKLKSSCLSLCLHRYFASCAHTTHTTHKTHAHTHTHTHHTHNKHSAHTRHAYNTCMSVSVVLSAPLHCLLHARAHSHNTHNATQNSHTTHIHTPHTHATQHTRNTYTTHTQYTQHTHNTHTTCWAFSGSHFAGPCWGAPASKMTMSKTTFSLHSKPLSEK